MKKLIFLTILIIISIHNLFAQETWYTLSTGNWSDATIWTLDPSTTPLPNNPSNLVPDAADHVVINSGRTVTLDVSNITVLSVEINGRLILSASTGNNFNVIKGNGIVEMVGAAGVDNFPAGAVTGSGNFSDPIDGGTLNVIGTGISLDQARTLNNLVIELTATTDVTTILADYTINGDLSIENGFLQMNDNASTTALNMTVNGDMLVQPNGQFRVGTANARHQLNLYGDFTNEGIASFSQRITQDENNEATDGIVDVNFLSNTQNQIVWCRGLTYFYRIVIDKENPVNEAIFNATAAANFNLTGMANYPANLNVSVPTDNLNAVGLITGTLRLGNNVTINTLTNNSNYGIGSNARLWIDGAIVANAGNGTVPYGVLQITAGTFDDNTTQGIVLRETGLIQVDGGTVTARVIRTSFLGSGEVGGYIQNGGSVSIDASPGGFNDDYSAFSLPYTGNVFIMSGGVLDVSGARNLDGGGLGGLIYINSDPGNVNVTGGTVIADCSTANTGNVITSRAPFYNLIIRNSINNTSNNAKIKVGSGSNGTGGIGSGTTEIMDPNLIVLNDLTIETGIVRGTSPNEYGGYLDLCPSNNCVNLEVGRNLTIEDSGVLDVWSWDGTNTDASNDNSATVTFNGTSNGTFYVGNITTYENDLIEFRNPLDGNANSFLNRNPAVEFWELPLYNVTIDKPGASLFLSAGNPGKAARPNSNTVSTFVNTTTDGKNTTSFGSNLIMVTNEMKLLQGTLNQVDPINTVQWVEDATRGNIGDPVAYSIRLLGGVVENSGNLFVYNEGITPREGIIVLRRGNGDITLSTTDGASFGNLRMLTGDDVVSITSDVEVGRLEILDGVMDIGSNNLKVDVIEYIPESFFLDEVGGQPILGLDAGTVAVGDNIDTYIRMNGNASDGGLSIKVSRSVYDIGLTDNEISDLVEAFSGAAAIEDGRVYNQPDILWFPIGTNASGTDKYTPAICYVNGGTYTGDEYITVNVVDKVLATTKQDIPGTNPDGILSYYWRVRHEGFGTGEEPQVAWMFQYDDADDDFGGANENTFVPGKVEDGGTYIRSYDGIAEAVKEAGDGGNDGNTLGINPRNIIIFNGVNTATTVNADGTPTVGSVASDVIDGANSAVYTTSTVNGAWNAAWEAGTFTLENANYTAGVPERFTDSPQIFYSRITSGTWYDSNWRDGNNWSLTAHNGAAAGDFPQAGDIAIIGSAAHTGGNSPNHSLNIRDGETVDVAEIQYDITANNQSRLVVWNSATLNFGLIRVNGNGTASFQQRFDPTDTPTITGDFGEYYVDNDALYILQMNSDGVYNYTPPTTIFPSLFIESSGDLDRTLIFEEDITTNFNCTLFTRATVQTSSDPTKGDINVLGNLSIRGIFEFGEGADRTVTVGGNVNLNGTSSVHDLVVLNTTPSSRRHRLIVEGNITQNQATARVDLYGGDIATNDHDPTYNNVILELNSSGTNTFNNTAGATPELYQVIIDKGTSTASSFTFNSDFALPTPANISEQPIEIVNGLLVLNATTPITGIDVILTDAARKDFYLPNTFNLAASSGSGGLEVRSGTVSLIGDNTGLQLDGLLRVSGGTVNIGIDGDGDNGNNFIQYTSSGNSIIEVSGGNLNVSSQVRRSLVAETGVLSYIQSGGDVVIAKEVGNAEASRGVFEVVNTGSQFIHTVGSLSFANSNGSAAIPSVYIDPTFSSFAAGTTLTFGTTDTDVATNFGVQIIPYTNNILTSNASGNNPTLTLYNTSLNVDGQLNIGTGTIFDADGRDLNLRGNNIVSTNSIFNNDGTFTSNDNTTYFTVTDTKTLTGSSIPAFYRLINNGSGITQLDMLDILATDDVNLSSGTLDTQDQTFEIQGDLLHDAFHISNTTPGNGRGIFMNGTSAVQTLNRSTPGLSSFGALTISNSNGVAITNNGFEFQVTNRLILDEGVFDIGGNLITLTTSAGDIENGTGGTSIADFTPANMIQTNSSIKDFGLKRFVNSGADEYVFPVGQLDYTPVLIQATALTSASGSFLVRPVNDIALGIVEDTEGLAPCADPEITDADNVLDYYWIIKSDGITNFSTANTDGNGVVFNYSNADVQFTAPYNTDNYGPAKLLNSSTSWDKTPLFADDFNATPNEIVFHFTSQNDNGISGIYTAGVTLDNQALGTQLCGSAIPDDIPVYETVDNGENTFGNTVLDPTIAGSNTWYDWDGMANPVPVGGPVGADIVVKAGFTLDLRGASVRLRKTTIEAGAIVKVDGSEAYNLGFVDGNGTIEIVGNGTDGKLPTGDYDEFFPTPIDCSQQGSLVYSGTGSYSFMDEISTVYNLTLSEEGTRSFPNRDLKICNTLRIEESGTGISVANIFNQDLEVLGDIIKTGGGFDSGSDLGLNQPKITLSGSTRQLIRGDFSGANKMNRVNFNNSSGFLIDENVPIGFIDVEEEIQMTNGIISVAGNERNLDETIDGNITTALRLNVDGEINAGNAGQTAVTNFSNSKHIDGPFCRELLPSPGVSGEYLMPLGDNPFGGVPPTYGPMAIVNPRVGTGVGNNARYWCAQYFREQPINIFSLCTSAMAENIVKTSSIEHWWVEDAPSNGETRMKLYWGAHSNVVSQPNNIRVVWYDDPSSTTGEWCNLNSVGGTIDAGSGVNFGSITTSDDAVGIGYLNFSDHYVTIATTNFANTPLPVELISFSGLLNENVIELAWLTANEINNSHFEVEKSVDGFNFSLLDSVASTGNNARTTNYQSVDINPQKGINYYRLKQIDLNGEFTYSEIIAVKYEINEKVNTEEHKVLIYPNPVEEGFFNLHLEGFQNSEILQIQIYDMLGREVYNQTSNTLNRRFYDEVIESQSILSKGIYILKVNDGLKDYNKRVVVK